MIAKARRAGADAIILDLEDGVAPEEKERARQTVARALEEGFPARLGVFLRVNSGASGLLESDLREAFRPQAHGICLPKCDTPELIHSMAAQLGEVEKQFQLPWGKIRLLPFIENARGVLNAAAIARCHARVCAIAFGAEDFTADIGVTRTRAGGELAYSRATISLAAHAAGVDPIDTIYADFKDDAGLRADCLVARQFGYTGKLVIHPAQIGPVHAALAPTSEEVDHARRVVAVFEDARARGTGVAVAGGAMVDRPVYMRAQRLLAIVARTPRAAGG